MVKGKVGIRIDSALHTRTGLELLLPVLAMLTFVLSWAGLFLSVFVEQWYARRLFPLISRFAERIADAVSFSWLDMAVPVGVVSVAWLIRRRRCKLLLDLGAAFYLILFWSWALNYHREPLSSKLQIHASNSNSGAIDAFATRAAGELNRLYKEKEGLPYDDAGTLEEAGKRVRRVIWIIDGQDWDAAHRVKVSWIANAWFHVAGIEGMFNPVGHEPVVSDTLLDTERPFVIAHELAHVRGYPDEGDAKFIAAFATLRSNNPA